jgi:hypothetical protein
MIYIIVDPAPKPPTSSTLASTRSVCVWLVRVMVVGRGCCISATDAGRRDSPDDLQKEEEKQAPFSYMYGAPTEGWHCLRQSGGAGVRAYIYHMRIAVDAHSAANRASPLLGQQQLATQAPPLTRGGAQVPRQQQKRGLFVGA